MTSSLTFFLTFLISLSVFAEQRYYAVRTYAAPGEALYSHSQMHTKLDRAVLVIEEHLRIASDCDDVSLTYSTSDPGNGLVNDYTLYIKSACLYEKELISFEIDYLYFSGGAGFDLPRKRGEYEISLIFDGYKISFDGVY